MNELSTIEMSEGKAFWAEGTAIANALEQDEMQPNRWIGARYLN